MPANQRSCFDAEGFIDILLLSLLPVQGSLNIPVSPGKFWFVCGVPPLLVSLLLTCACRYPSPCSPSHSHKTDFTHPSVASNTTSSRKPSFLVSHLELHVSLFLPVLPRACTCASWKKCQFPSCVRLCNPMDCSLPGSSVHGILEYWRGLPCPPPENLPNPRTEPGSPALQADSLPSWATREDTCVLLGK